MTALVGGAPSLPPTLGALAAARIRTDPHLAKNPPKTSTPGSFACCVAARITTLRPASRRQTESRSRLVLGLRWAIHLRSRHPSPLPRTPASRSAAAYAHARFPPCRAAGEQLGLARDHRIVRRPPLQARPRRVVDPRSETRGARAVPLAAGNAGALGRVHNFRPCCLAAGRRRARTSSSRSRWRARALSSATSPCSCEATQPP